MIIVTLLAHVSLLLSLCIDGSDHEKSNEEFHLSQTPWGLVVHPGQKKPEGVLKGPYRKSMRCPRPPAPRRGQSWSWSWWQGSDFTEDEAHWEEKTERPLSQT